MLVELAGEIMDKAEISNEILRTFIQMIAKPSLYVFRGLAIFGMIYPIISLVGLNRKRSTNYLIGQVVLVFFWIVINAGILSTSIDMYWKWVWIDMAGLLSAVSVAITLNNNTIRQHYRNLYRKKIVEWKARNLS